MFTGTRFLLDFSSRIRYRVPRVAISIEKRGKVSGIGGERRGGGREKGKKEEREEAEGERKERREPSGRKIRPRPGSHWWRQSGGAPKS